MAATASSTTSPSWRPRLSGWLRRLASSDLLILWLSVAYALVLGPFVPGFASPANLTNVLIAVLPLFILALGQTFVLITGGIDLSITSIVALASVLGALAMNDNAGWLAGSPVAAPAAVLLMLATGTVVGVANGIAVARLRMPAFIVTLTGMMFFSGLAVWITKSKNIGGLPAAFNVIGANPWSAFAAATLAGGFSHLLLTRSLFGRWLFAVGQNHRVAHISGVPVTSVTIAAYAACGACAGLASVLYTGQAETGSPILGQRLLLDVIGATILGGTSLFGGKGSVLWTLCGVLFLKLVDNSLNLLSLSVFTITMLKGSVILFAALLDAARVRLKTAGRI
ncbi:MAG: ABC transporter permease [Opitutaceae bacterium]|nr:ABC transporter permease [Opitutaceae bacterium]